MFKIDRAFKRAGVLLLVLLWCAATAFAQEKKQPPKPQAPPTKIKLPADSTKTDSLQAAKKQAAIKPDDERLQLPDVLIYGSGTEKRTAGKKITISPDQPELVNPPSLYNPLQTDELDKGRRQDVLQSDADSKLRQFELSAFGGNYENYGGNGKFWQALSGFDFGIEADYGNLGGQFDNSQREQFSLGMRLGLAPAASNRWRLFAQYAAADFGLHGSALNNHTRESIATAAKLSGDFEFSSAVKSTIEAEFEKGDVRDKIETASVNLPDLENTFYAISGDLRANFFTSELKLQAKTLEDRLESAINDSAKTNWRALNLSYNFALSRKISAELSANYTAVSVDGAGSESRIRPGVRLFLAPSRRLVASVGYSSGFDYLPWKNALASNNYLANGTRPLPEDIKWKVAANIDWQVSKGFVFKAKYENKRIDGLNYFLRDSLGTFALHSGDFKLGLASVGGLLTFSDAMKLEFSLSIFDDALQVGETFDNLIDVPYRGAFRAPVTLTLSPRENLTFETSLAWIGARRTALMQVVEAQGENPRFQELPAYLYTSIHASLQFSRHFEAFAQANNLFDDNFDGWQGYREMGINGLIGLKYIW